MPINKSAKIRYNIIDECLRNPKVKWTKNNLLEYVNRRLELHNGTECMISISQIRYDLQNMQIEFGAPIETKKEGRSFYYYYEDPNFSINNIPINKEDIEVLNGLFVLLNHLEAFTIVKEAKMVVSKIEAIANIECEISNKLVQYSHQLNINTTETLEDLFQCILQKNTLKITYDDNGVSTDYIRPYILKEYKGKWFLLACTKETESLKLYPIDQIISIAVVNISIPNIEQTNIEGYFDDYIGISNINLRTEPEIVTLQLKGDIAKECLAKPIHHSQKIISSNNNTDISLTINIVINKDLEDLIINMGSDAIVIGPEKLRDNILNRINLVAKAYIKKMTPSNVINHIGNKLYRKAV